MTQFEQFAEELTVLCQKYEVEIKSSGYDASDTILVASSHPSKSDWGDLLFKDGRYTVAYEMNLTD